MFLFKHLGWQKMQFLFKASKGNFWSATPQPAELEECALEAVIRHCGAIIAELLKVLRVKACLYWIWSYFAHKVLRTCYLIYRSILGSFLWKKKQSQILNCGRVHKNCWPNLK